MNKICFSYSSIIITYKIINNILLFIIKAYLIFLYFIFFYRIPV